MKKSSVLKRIIPFPIGVKIRGFWQRIMAIYYTGSKYYCPYCKRHFRKMLKGGFDFPVIKEKHIVGGGYRINDVCPRCYSTDRDRLVFLYLKNKTDIFEKKIKLLHIAPEGCLKALLLSYPNIEYFTGDKYSKGYQGYYYDRDVIQMDITNIPYEDNKFDVIICNHVLEHITDDKAAMSELFRVLKPGGWAMLQVPISLVLDKTFEDKSITSEKDREKYFGQFDHIRIYAKDYKDKLENVGFKVTIHSPFKENWNITDIEKYAINPEEEIYIAHK